MRKTFLVRAGVLLVTAVLAACETVAPAPAARPAPPPIPSAEQIDARQKSLDNRVEQGYRDGRLTRDELTILRRMSADIRRDEQRYRTGDGYLSPEERRALGNQLDAFSREVSRQLGDADRR